MIQKKKERLKLQKEFNKKTFDQKLASVNIKTNARISLEGFNLLKRQSEYAYKNQLMAS